MNLWVPWKAENFLTSRTTINFSRTLFHAPSVNCFAVKLQQLSVGWSNICLKLKGFQECPMLNCSEFFMERGRGWKLQRTLDNDLIFVQNFNHLKAIRHRHTINGKRHTRLWSKFYMEHWSISYPINMEVKDRLHMLVKLLLHTAQKLT